MMMARWSNGEDAGFRSRRCRFDSYAGCCSLDIVSGRVPARLGIGW